VKKLFIYRINSSNWYDRLRVYFYQLLGYQVFAWGEHKFPIIKCKKITFPSAKNSVEYEPIARREMANYFDVHQDMWSGDIYRRDYILKTLDMSVLDYYAFEQTILGLIDNKDKVKIISPVLFCSIFRNIKPSRNFLILTGYPIWLARLTLKFIKDLMLSFVSKETKPAPKIVYYRKKIYPDLGEYASLCKRLNTKDQQTILGVYPILSRKQEQFGFYFLNVFKGTRVRLVKSYLVTLKHSLNNLVFYFKNGVEGSIFSKCLVDTYLANIVLKMNPAIICGVLVDKPLYVLFYKYKNRETKIMSLNESFFFSPNRSFDFNHLDRYYSMNQIDEQMQNNHGGNIKSFKQVEFFRNVPKRENGISDELSDMVKKYKYCIVLLPAQVYVEKTGFNYWAYDELTDFLRHSLSLAEFMTDTLFIVKGKKGELKLLTEWFHDLDQAHQNIFVIHCNKPRDLEKNRFEDLIGISDLSVSMALTSTTVWQSIARNKPIIAINRTSYPSVLSKYQGWESSLSELQNTITYWKSLSKSETLSSINKMKEDFNIGQCQGLDQVALDLEKTLKG